jgi:hypothetical protein
MRADNMPSVITTPLASLRATVVAAAIVACACGQDNSMNALGEPYVRFVLAVGQHDADYVDACYGPPGWRSEAEAKQLSLAEIAARAMTLGHDIAAAAPPQSADELARLRHTYLARQLASLRARVTMLSGTRLRFDEESQALYDAVAPVHRSAEFDNVSIEPSIWRATKATLVITCTTPC